MAVNKVEVNGETKLDLTRDTVTPENLLSGATAHNAAGEQINGAVAPVRYDAAQSLTDAQKTQARGNISAMQGIESTDYPGCYYVLNGSTVEWINPPMQLGVEYRTTERYLGKPVYVKLINCGNLPDGATKEVTHGIANIGFIVGAQATASNSTIGFNGHAHLPEIYGGSLTNQWTNYLADADASKIIVFCGGGLAGCLVYVTFKYTKTTD